MTTNHSGPPHNRMVPPGGPGRPAFGNRQQPRARKSRFSFGLPRPISQFFSFVVVPLALLALIASGIGYVRLLHGPVSLKAFSERIEKNINRELDGFTVRIDDAVIALRDDYAVELQLINLRISEPDGDLVAQAPMAAMDLNKAALWQLEAAPERVYLIEPRLAVVYTDTQGFALSIADASLDSAEPIAVPRPTPATRPVPSGSPEGTATLPPAFHRVDLARLLAESSARARGGQAATSRLRKFGVRNAAVTLSYNGQVSELVVADASVDLEHMKRRSVISGSATIDSGKGPWSLTFRTEDSERHDLVKVAATVSNLVPSTLAKLAPDLALLQVIETPLNGDFGLDLSSTGDLRSATLALDIGRGFVKLSSFSNTPLLMDGGRLAVTYDAASHRFAIEPSSLDWGGSRMTVVGDVTRATSATGQPQWNFAINSVEGVLSAEEFDVAPMPIDGFVAKGRAIPDEGLIQLSELSLRAGGGEVNVDGEIISGAGGSSSRVVASVTPMPLTTLKAMWPRAVAPTAREWVGEHVQHANLGSASFKLLSGRFLEMEDGANPVAGAPSGERLSASIAITDIAMRPLPNSLPIEAAQASIRLENSTLEVTVPEASIVAGPTRRLPLKTVRLTVVDLTHDAPIAELAFKSQTTLPVLVDTLNASQLNLAGQGPLPIDGIDGKVDGELKIFMPLVTGGSVLKAEGKARVTEVKGKSKEHDLTLSGGSVDINVSDIGVIATGKLIVNGVSAQLHMHRILDAPPDMQPPLRISATLDNADRTQFGLDVNHFAQGDVAVEITVAHKEGDEKPTVHFRGDLTNAELLLTSLAWRKAPGRKATLEFDVTTNDNGTTDLKNFRLMGDNIAVDGWVRVDEKREVQEFAFPNFSLNIVSRLDVRGTFNAKRIWNIAVKGTTFDAKDLFSSLIALGSTTEAEVKAIDPAAGMDITAEIGTVLGHSDVSLRNYKLKVSERKDVIVSLEGHGTLDGGKPFAVAIPADGPRRLFADSTDAGQTFKLIGFYPNLQGGRLRLQVDLEARGAAEKSGVLWVEDFRVLGDPIISEVYSSVEGGGDQGGGNRKRRVEREVFEFTGMKVPFSVGHGQFVLDDSYLRGPLLGASIRGKVDYNAQRISLGGTYVPLQGINSAVCDIPLVGPIVAGFDCQGVFGITYAIQGSLAQPQVLVNPLSMFTPGILRGIMEMTNPNPQVQPLREQKRAPTNQRVRASSSEPSGPVDGWSSETMPGDSKGAKKK